MKKYLLGLLLLSAIKMHAQNHVLIGYWHNWDDLNNARYVPLNQIDSRYNVICIAFAVPTSPSDMNMKFVPDGVTQATFLSQVQALQAQGKKVLISIGGATANVEMPTTTQRDNFANTMRTIINTYGFNGIDIDIEHGNSIKSSGTVTNPTNVNCINFIDAVKKVRDNFLTDHGLAMMLTFAPETAYYTGGLSYYGGNTIYGGYLPIIYALRNDLSYIHMQLYNSGSQYGVNMVAYNQATADFVIALTEAVIRGFTVWGNQGTMPGIPANKVVIGLPACPAAAPGGGHINAAVLKAAVKYLRGTGPKPGDYTLINPAGYPNLAGLMDWSINWDKMTTSNATAYEFAAAYEDIFGIVLPVKLTVFYAQQKGNDGLIKWESQTEMNFAGYELQHSLDGVNFRVIKNISVNSNSNLKKEYHFLHEGIPIGNNYYRLKMIDVDGSFTYSKIVLLLTHNKSEFTIYPNPAIDIIYIKNSPIFLNDYELKDMNGRVVLKGKIYNGALNVATLSAGNYVITTGKHSAKFMKL